MAHVALIGAFPDSLINFRGDLIETLVQAGHQVTAMAGPAEQGHINQIEALGAQYKSFPVNRNSLNPFTDLKTLLSIRRSFKELKPDVVLAYTIKPVIWGGIAAMTVPGTNFHALITGLGFTFQGQGWHRKLLTKTVSLLYKIALSRARTVIFQNSDDCQTFVSRSIVAANKCHIVGGSGVNLKKFTVSKVPVEKPVFLVIARLLVAKGLFEFANAARIVKQNNFDATFKILGPADPSPDAIEIDQIHQWQAEGIIQYLGETKDVRPFIRDCSVFVLPSYHEGMPRTVLEALATGRPILTTDVSGCRETVKEHKNGFLVPPKDAQALAERMEWFLKHPGQWQKMGDASRRLAEERFDVRKINAEMLQITGLSGSNKK